MSTRHYVDFERLDWHHSLVAERSLPRSPSRSEKVVDAWLRGQRSDNTRAAYRIDLETFGRWCAQRQEVPIRVDTEVLAAFGAARQAAGDSDATMRRRWSSLSSLFDYAVNTGVVSTNPVDGIARPRELAPGPDGPAALSRAAVDACLEMAAALDPRLDALVSMLALDGIKLGEALALDVDDISGRAPRTAVMVRRNGTVRRVVLDEMSARAVRRCAARRSGQPLFVSDHRGHVATPQRLTRFGADHLIRQLRTADNERVTANQLRRYFHSSRSTTQPRRSPA